jgi:aminopeptidase-like protein
MRGSAARRRAERLLRKCSCPQNLPPIFAARDQGAAAYALIKELYPICRSIAGPGVTATLDIIERFVPLKRTQAPTGTKVFYWEVPRE